MEAHCPGIAGACNNGLWEVAREAQEVEELCRVCHGLPFHRSHPLYKTLGFKAALILWNKLWGVKLLLM